MPSVRCLNGINEMGSLLESIPAELSEELFETICSTENVKIERIVSKGHSSPEGLWYDQDWNEFVLVVQGSAGLQIEGEDNIVALNAGDYLNIGSHVKHRVEWTDSSCETIWLAVHY
jgi:cupin 2 domain-containing protein